MESKQEFKVLSPLMVEEIAALVDARLAAQDKAGADVDEYQRRLALINAKEYVTAREGAMLLNCSDGHLRNLAREARKGRRRYPIPYRDLDGVITFPREELLKWAEQPKLRLAKAS